MRLPCGNQRSTGSVTDPVLLLIYVVVPQRVSPKKAGKYHRAAAVEGLEYVRGPSLKAEAPSAGES